MGGRDTGSGWEGGTQAVGGLKDTGSGWEGGTQAVGGREGHRQWAVGSSTCIYVCTHMHTYREADTCIEMHRRMHEQRDRCISSISYV